MSKAKSLRRKTDSHVMVLSGRSENVFITQVFLEIRGYPQSFKCTIKPRSGEAAVLIDLNDLME
ncbi:hypothetical protein SCHPADRAFT_900706 [Schizopora paradoxa]|uniref:Uncharacterized protein n=1 Tax=Schizopora paradoxa TaxID=27342 RepID=A0A0H2SK47_9AGAM|nr:hypothetical protein SCHPADRAFT_900706 [Schizopora paradoxa]